MANSITYNRLKWFICIFIIIQTLGIPLIIFNKMSNIHMIIDNFNYKNCNYTNSDCFITQIDNCTCGNLNFIDYNDDLHEAILLKDGCYETKADYCLEFMSKFNDKINDYNELIREDRFTFIMIIIMYSVFTIFSLVIIVIEIRALRDYFATYNVV